MPETRILEGQLGAVPRPDAGYDLCIRPSADVLYRVPLTEDGARELAVQLTGGGLLLAPPNAVPGLRA